MKDIYDWVCEQKSEAARGPGGRKWKRDGLWTAEQKLGPRKLWQSIIFLSHNFWSRISSDLRCSFLLTCLPMNWFDSDKWTFKQGATIHFIFQIFKDPFSLLSCSPHQTERHERDLNVVQTSLKACTVMLTALLISFKARCLNKDAYINKRGPPEPYPSISLSIYLLPILLNPFSVTGGLDPSCH